MKSHARIGDGAAYIQPAQAVSLHALGRQYEAWMAGTGRLSIASTRWARVSTAA